MVFTVDGHSLSLESVVEVAERGAKVRMSAASVRKMERYRARLDERVKSGQVVYGVNTGFGSLADKVVPPGKVEQLQLNLVRSHAAGVGEPMPGAVVRAAMLLRLNSLLNGNSAARTSVAELLAEMLNKGVTPFVPSFGSLGASGDLVPSAHVALTMIGEGKAFYRGRLLESGRALKLAGLKRVELAAKEGLSLINGTCFTTAFSAMCIQGGKTLLEAANGCVALTGEALGASVQSFDPRLMALKKNGGQGYVAERIRAMMKGSRKVRDGAVPQDPYSIRCAPQVHGSLKEALDFAETITVNEANSVSDNPVFMEDGAVLHGGNFHAQPVAMAVDLLAYAAAYLGVMALARIHFILGRTPPERKYMAGNPGLESGLMILEYTASALAAENAKHSYPLSTYPADVSGGIEDHASYGVNVGLKARAVEENVSRILAIEMICASNFIGGNTGGLSSFSKTVCTKVRRLSPILRGDRPLSEEIELVSRELLEGRLVTSA